VLHLLYGLKGILILIITYVLARQTDFYNTNHVTNCGSYIDRP
jgi:hypothetical protein